MAIRPIQTAAVATVAYKAGKKRGSKSVKATSLKQGAHKGRKPVGNPGGSARPPYTVLPVSTVALSPGSGPPMSSTPTGRGASVSPVQASHASLRKSSSRAKRGSSKK